MNKFFKILLFFNTIVILALLYCVFFQYKENKFLRSYVYQLEYDIDNLANSNNGYDYSELEEKIDNIESDLDDLESNYWYLDSNISSIKSDIWSLESRVSGLE